MLEEMNWTGIFFSFIPWKEDSVKNAKNINLLNIKKISAPQSLSYLFSDQILFNKL